MAANVTFFATDDADWIEAIQPLDDDTNEPLADVATATEFELRITECGDTVMSALLSDATITKPNAYTIRWDFTVDQLGALCIGTTYGVGLTMTTSSNQVVQLISGSLVFKDGSRP